MLYLNGNINRNIKAMSLNKLDLCKNGVMIRDYEGSIYAELLIFHTYAGLTRHLDFT